MKLSLASAGLILAVAAIFFWRNQEHLTALRMAEQRFAAEADALGIPADMERLPTTSRNAERSREYKRETAHTYARECISFAQAMNARLDHDRAFDERIQSRILTLEENLLNLDSHQLRIVGADILSNPDLDDGMRGHTLNFWIMMLSHQRPAEALAILGTSSGMFGDKGNNGMSAAAFATCLTVMADRDPMATLEWMRENAASYPEIITDDVKRDILAGAARQNPQLAFQLLDELGFSDPGLLAGALEGIIRSASSPQEFHAMLAAVRNHAGTIRDAYVAEQFRRLALSTMGTQIAADGIPGVETWLAASDLTAADQQSLVDGVSYSVTKAETGQWIEWLGKTMSGPQLELRVRALMSDWTRADYQAAGTWLNSIVDGPVKQSAVQGYVEAVAPYDPQTATQWAETLAPETTRTGLFDAVKRR